MKGLKIERIRSLKQLLRWRGEVLKEVFGSKVDSDLLKANARYYDFHEADGSHIALEAKLPDENNEYHSVGCGGICFSEELPNPSNPSGRCAHIMNVYVRKQFRHSGVGGDILRALLDIAKFRGCGKIMLETTDETRNFYHALGFRETESVLFYPGK